MCFAARGKGKASEADVPLIVSGCADHRVSKILNGSYFRHGTNHGKPVYKKQEETGSDDMLVYYWDDRDGDANCGWWFSRSVGSERVYAYNPSREARRQDRSMFKTASSKNHQEYIYIYIYIEGGHWC